MFPSSGNLCDVLMMMVRPVGSSEGLMLVVFVNRKICVKVTGLFCLVGVVVVSLLLCLRFYSVCCHGYDSHFCVPWSIHTTALHDGLMCFLLFSVRAIPFYVDSLKTM